MKAELVKLPLLGQPQILSIKQTCHTLPFPGPRSSLHTSEAGRPTGSCSSIPRVSREHGPADHGALRTSPDSPGPCGTWGTLETWQCRTGTRQYPCPAVTVLICVHLAGRCKGLVTLGRRCTIKFGTKCLGCFSPRWPAFTHCLL